MDKTTLQNLFKNKMFKVYFSFIVFIVLSPLSFSEEKLTVYAAGSLKVALTEVITNYEHDYAVHVNTKFGPSGLLRKSIEQGDKPDLFASANMKHPDMLAANDWGGPVVLFARNQLCALCQQALKVTKDSLLNHLLDESIRVGTSTPKADPSGDYAWALFQKAEGIQPGSFSILSNKALQLTGGVNSESAPGGRNQYAWVMNENKADIFLTYCTNAVLAKKEAPTLQVINVPANLSVGANYGLLVRADANTATWQLAMYILSPQGQKILENHGFNVSASTQ